MNSQSHRPRGYTGAGDRYFPRIERELKRFLIKTQHEFRYDTLHLSNKEWADLTGVLVEFREDIHNDIGIWKSLEQYQLEFFATPLPLFIRSNEEVALQRLNEYRLCHLLWVLYNELKPDVVLAPTHQDLRYLASQVDGFLARQFAKVPRASGVKQFLAQPNRFGWDVKQKLVWLGQHSYLFRHNFWNYIAANGGPPDIGTIDDFICQEPTSWSGLGVIDILAATLDLTSEQRATLRNWYERHVAYYRILSVQKSHLEVKNLINDQAYRIRVDDPGSSFKAGQVVFGSLVPWEGEWYWSGGQQLYQDVPVKVIQEIKQTFIQKMPTIAYRYCRPEAERARESVDRLYREFVEYHGDDLIIYPDGQSMVADLQELYRRHNEALAGEAGAEVLAKRNLSSLSPSASLPPELLEQENGLAVYFNAGEGQEIMVGFNDVASGLKKRGQDLTEDETEAIRALIDSDAISPDFVRRLVKQYGDQSIASAFLIDSRDDKTYLDYLLRRYKGHFYRNRYPQISLV
jgi:hypothetical protein